MFSYACCNNTDLFFDDDDLEEGEIVPEPDLNNIFKKPYGFNEFEDPILEDPSVEEKQALELKRKQTKERMLNLMMHRFLLILRSI